MNVSKLFLSHNFLVKGVFSQECLLKADLQVKHKSAIELDKGVLLLGENTIADCLE